MPPISIMIKPASSSCNLDCKYCFYHSLAKQRSQDFRGIISPALFQDIIKKAFAFTKGSPVILSFQGGEPLLAGKDFFKNVKLIIDEQNIYGSPVYVGIQTNGTLVDSEWCGILKSLNALVGLSLDGDEKANAFRVDTKGRPTFDKVLKTAELFKKHSVEFNILTVLTKAVAERIDSIYGFFRSKGFKHLQFIPCLKPLGGCDDDSDLSLYMSKEDYSNFLKKCFSQYLKDYVTGHYTSIRQFDNMVLLSKGKQAEQCGMNGHCCHQFVIEADGETFPCDFYCTDTYSLGHIQESDFFKLSSHPVAVKFIKESLVLEDKCKVCDYFALCRGGCKRERGDISFCEAYKDFFPQAIPHFKRMN